jgi:hypothetical protein
MRDNRRPSQDAGVLGIPDVRSLPLDVVLSTEDSALSKAVLRLVEDLGRPAEQYTAHGTSVTPLP